MEVGADLYYRIKDPVLSVNAVQNLDNSTRVIGQTSLQKQVLRSELAVLESNKFHVCQGIQVREGRILQDALNLDTSLSRLPRW